MNTEQYIKAFTEKAETSGYSSEIIQKCLAYAVPLLDKNLPVIYNLSHLSALVGYNTNYLKRAVFFTKFFYKKYRITKASGGFRIINEPLPSLKDVQVWILGNLLNKVVVSRFAKAYIKGQNLKQNLVFHKNQRFVVSLDIENFFTSIKRRSVEEIFSSLGYSAMISNFLGKLCCLDDCLPQGASTSPYLSNLYLLNFDEIIGEYCLNNHIRYSRYADDMTFSGNDINLNELLTTVKLNLTQLGLSLNNDKTKVMRSDQRQIVTGIIVNDKIQVPRIKRKEIRQEVYYIKTKGLYEHLRFIESKKANYLDHLLGKINFVLQINPTDKEFISYRIYVRSLLLTSDGE